LSAELEWITQVMLLILRQCLHVLDGLRYSVKKYGVAGEE
jgi:hypothetical protein